MKPLPVVLRQFAFQDRLSHRDLKFLDQDIDAGQDTAQVRLLRIGAPGADAASVPGYFVMSSASPNIESHKDLQEAEVKEAAQGVQAIARHLYDICCRDDAPIPELIISVHGYNSSRSSVRDWYKDIFQYANRYDSAIARRGSQVYIGYRWPSESIEPKRIGEAFFALPALPRFLMVAGFLGAFLLLWLDIYAFGETVPGIVLSVLLAGLLGIAIIIATLVILRISVYFRDRYRAQNFGVLDLVELLRQIDQTLVQLKAQDLEPYATNGRSAREEAAQFWLQTKRKVKLSFLGHSMGAFVVTSVVRILSDVFDLRSIKNQPPADVGSVFCLERLMLTSPDIPILTIVSSRANFLSTSLRRFSESYLFCNEGDLALRIASATVNYFAFPSNSEAMGYRLGNVAIKRTSKGSRDFGILNLFALRSHFFPGAALAESLAQDTDKVMDFLFLNHHWLWRDGRDGYDTLADLFYARHASSAAADKGQAAPAKPTIADFFTYFDCTDYRDVTFSVKTRTESRRARGLLTRAYRKQALRWWDYVLLMVDSVAGRRDVHGGYFHGKFTQEMIYRITFLGFTGYLHTLDDDATMAFDASVALSKLHMRCQELGIQGFLSPMRYQVDIQGQDIAAHRHQFLEAIDEAAADEQ